MVRAATLLRVRRPVALARSARHGADGRTAITNSLGNYMTIESEPGQLDGRQLNCRLATCRPRLQVSGAADAAPPRRYVGAVSSIA